MKKSMLVLLDHPEDLGARLRATQAFESNTADGAVMRGMLQLNEALHAWIGSEADRGLPRDQAMSAINSLLPCSLRVSALQAVLHIPQVLQFLETCGSGDDRLRREMINTLRLAAHTQGTKQ